LALVALLGGCALVLRAVRDGFSDMGSFDLDLACLGAGFTPDDVSVVERGPGGEPPRWSTSLPAPATSPPVAAGGRVLVRTAAGGVVALDAGTGTIAWDVAFGRPPLLGTDFAPVVDGDTAFVTDWDGAVHAVDVATGSARWTTSLPPPSPGPDPASAVFPGAPSAGAPLLVDGTTVYVGAQDLVALDRVTGAVRWTAPVGNTARQGYSPPARQGPLVVVGAGNADVHAFDAGTGTPVWSVTPGTGDGSVASPTVAVAPAGLVVTGARPDAVVVLDPASGTELRSVPGGPFGEFGSVAGIAGDLAYVRGNTLDALDPASGRVVWHSTTLGPTDFDFNPPTVTDTLVITPGGDGRLHAVDRTDGREHWAIGRYRTGRCHTGSAALPPAMTDTTMIVVSGDQHVVAFDRTDSH
jgi:outer membrane protein assembly factor BamB